MTGRSLDILLHSAGRQFNGHHVAFFAGNRSIQHHHGFFESRQTRARIFDGHLRDRQVRGQLTGARLQLPQFPFKSQQSGPFFQRPAITCVHKLATRYPIAFDSNKHVARGQRECGGSIECVHNAGVHSLRQGALQHLQEFFRRVQDIGDARTIDSDGNVFLLRAGTNSKVAECFHGDFIATTMETGNEEIRAARVIVLEPGGCADRIVGRRNQNRLES